MHGPVSIAFFPRSSSTRFQPGIRFTPRNVWKKPGSLAALAVNESCLELAQLYLERGYVPKSEIRDALHIAVAVIWKVDYLLTWNCKHIANAHALRQLRKFSENQGYEFPHVCTPEEL